MKALTLFIVFSLGTTLGIMTSRQHLTELGQPYSITVQKETPQLIDLCIQDENCMDIELFADKGGL